MQWIAATDIRYRCTAHTVGFKFKRFWPSQQKVHLAQRSNLDFLGSIWEFSRTLEFISLGLTIRSKPAPSLTTRSNLVGCLAMLYLKTEGWLSRRRTDGSIRSMLFAVEFLLKHVAGGVMASFLRFWAMNAGRIWTLPRKVDLFWPSNVVAWRKDSFHYTRTILSSSCHWANFLYCISAKNRNFSTFEVWSRAMLPPSTFLPQI
jgi:hypothetical protein